MMFHRAFDKLHFTQFHTYKE